MERILVSATINLAVVVGLYYFSPSTNFFYTSLLAAMFVNHGIIFGQLATVRAEVSALKNQPPLPNVHPIGKRMK